MPSRYEQDYSERSNRGEPSHRYGRGRSDYDYDEDEGGRRHRGQMRGGEMRHERAMEAHRDREGYSEDRGQGGWFGDPEGHSEASRRGWQHSSHEGSGWYGDPEGHSRASQRGWEHSGHEGSGWYGDSEGHSRAASQRGRGGRYENEDRYERYERGPVRSRSRGRYD
jgi:hypothetical protein